MRESQHMMEGNGDTDEKHESVGSRLPHLEQPEGARDRWVAMDEWPATQRGQGKVWRVKDRDDPTAPPYMLKEMRYQKGPASLAYRRFVREISVMTELSGAHPNIVPVIAHGIPAEGDGWLPFYVMPRAEGSLERARDLVGSLEVVLKIGIEIATALEVAHERGVIHRDVKPANILLYGDERRPALADFGICHLETEDRLTGVDAHTVGSGHYVAPELEGGGQRDNVSPGADVYSLGKTLYAVVSGREPFPREDHRKPEWDLTSRFSDTRYEHLHGLLDRMTAVDPEARFATMHECRDALERAVENVRAGRAYRSGMYGGDRLAAVRFDRAQRALSGKQGGKATDVFLEVVSEGELSARILVEQSTPPGRDVDYFGDLLPADGSLAGAMAEELLVAGLIAIEENVREFEEEWWQRTRHWILTQRLDTRRAKLLYNAAVAAAFGAAIVAWRRRRWELLDSIIADVSKYGSRFVHLDVGDEDWRDSAEWVVGFISSSHVIQQSEPGATDRAATQLALVTGLALIKDFATMPPDRLTELQQPSTRIEGDRYIALHPDYREWLDLLPELCMRSRGTERGVAAVLGVPEAELRAVLQRTTPILRRYLAQVSRDLRRDAFWVSNMATHGVWARWISDEHA